LIRSLCLILLTAFFICKATDVLSILLVKDKTTVVCNSDDCENEKPESEKSNDDQQIYNHSLTLDQHLSPVIVRVSFCYSAPTENEIFRNLFSPPPELV
jgi:hypothetical protein